MAELERTSWTSLSVIPEDKRLLMHRMYEDSDLVGADTSEAVVDFLNAQTPGLYIGILANDSVTPPCCNQELHYECDFYEPYWYTILVSKATWDEYKEAVIAKDQEWKSTHGCKLVKAKA